MNNYKKLSRNFFFQWFYTIRHLVFELDISPGLLFKRKNCNSMKALYKNMIFTNQLALLVIPKAKLFTVDLRGKKYEAIAEQKVDTNSHHMKVRKLQEIND
ncbi:MAG: hypothetical protein QG627_1305 [Chlamydiota bacterium]|nr:hypothetical protein [Chlamydiota bacterium]